MLKLQWQADSPYAPAFHLAHYQLFPPRRVRLHTHEFAEITLIESGEGRQVINDSTFPLKPGGLFLIRPTDCHSIDAGRNGIVLVNLAFPLEQAIQLENQFLPDGLRYFRSTAKLPWSTRLDDKSFAHAENLFKNLASAAHDRFELGRAIMNIFSILRKPSSDLPLGKAPDWLQQACVEMHQPAHLAKGFPALIRFAGRSPEHTARVLRKHSGVTPTEFINRLRIDHTARLLRNTDKSVLDIALECGFESQGHFHRCFKARFETTPLTYRKKNHPLIF